MYGGGKTLALIEVTIDIGRRNIVLRRGEEKLTYSKKRYEFFCALLEADKNKNVSREHV